ncbi:MAG TPA: isoprenylcysteine carboxylmethyltransferase family protein [Planctomycetota bacterium]|nr:isoprenylcysteine carboxylmethyltransferase family protein [Planctomycetota bacterium]
MHEHLVRAALALYALLGLSVTVGRSVLFWKRHRARPVAPPRDGFERFVHVCLRLLLVAMLAVGIARAASPRTYARLAPWLELESNATLAAGVAIYVAGFALMLVAGEQMGRSWRIGIPDERTRLVTHGLYRFVRNPIYAGLEIALVGYAVLLPGPVPLAIAAAAAVVLPFWVRAEERRQLELHGDEFRRYRETTGRFVPRLSRRRSPDRGRTPP